MNKRYIVFAASSPQFHFWFSGKLEEEGVSLETCIRYRDPFSLYGIDCMSTEAVFLRGWENAIPSREREDIRRFLFRLEKGRKDLIMCNTVLEKLQPPTMVEKPLAKKKTSLIQRLKKLRREGNDD